MTIPTSLVALFCEDIREEKSGALTLSGVFPDNVAVPPLPSPPPAPNAIPAMPKLCIYARLHFDPRAEFESVVAKLVFPDGRENVVAAMDPPSIAKAKRESLEQGTPIAAVISRIMMAPFPVAKLGRLRFEISIGEQTFVGGALNFLPGEAVTDPTQTIVSLPLS